RIGRRAVAGANGMRSGRRSPSPPANRRSPLHPGKCHLPGPRPRPRARRSPRGMEWRRLLPAKFIAGVLGVRGGFALGPAGPTIQMGGATGLMVSEWFRITPGLGERKALIAAGGGAGLAAAFNAPLAGLVFVLEEVAGSFTPVVFVSTFLASVTA